MAKYRGKNIHKFVTAVLCAFAFVMCFALTSAWGQSHNERTHNQIAEAANAAENSGDTNAWQLRDYPREETFLVNLIKKYYGEQQTGSKTEEDCRRELKSTRGTTGNMAAFGTGARNSKIGTKDNKPCIQIQTYSEIKAATGHPGPSDPTKTSITTDPLLVVNPDLMPRNNDNKVIFPSDKFWDLKPDDATERDGVHICQLYFDDAGVVDGEHVDMVFRVNSLRVKGRTAEGGQYGWPATKPGGVGLVFGRIKTKTIWEQYIKNYTPTTEKPINPEFPQVAGTISLTSDNLVWNSGHCKGGAKENLQVEVDYSISIVTRDGEKPMPFQYPVYTLYSDLDVHASNKSEESLTNVLWSNEYDSSTSTGYKQYSTTSGDTINCFFDESITPYENTYPYAYRFKPATSESVSPFSMTYATNDVVKTGAPTFSSLPHYYKNSSNIYEYCSAYSDDFPSSWYNTGILVTSDPSSASGAYSAVWRGVKCETGISLSPCPSYTAHKYVEKETAHKLEADQAYVEPVTSGVTTDADGYYTFDVDFGDKDQGGSGNYGVDMFYTPDTLKFIDYLPAGMELLTGEDLQAAITKGDIKLVRHYNDSTKADDDIDIAKDTSGKYVITKEEVKDTSGKVVSYKISVTVDETYLKSTWKEGSVTKANFNGSTWRMKLKARPKSLTESTTTSAAGYSTGEVAKYPDTTIDMWKYQNYGAVDSENYEFKSHPLDIYTPLFGHDYTFYKMNADGTTTTDPVPAEVTTAAKPDSASNTHKVGETVKLKEVLKSETPVPKATSVKDNYDNLWLFTQWKETELTVANPGADLNFIGYWKKIDKPVEIKEYDESKKGQEGFIVDNSAVQLNDNIAYELIATNNKYPTSAQVSFTDIPSVGLTFNPSSVVVKKELNGVTTTLTAGTDFVFTNNLTDNKGDGEHSLVWNFDADHPVEYTAKIIITYYNTVNIQALTLDTVNNKCTIKVGDTSTVYQLSNPVVKQITAKLDGKKVWDDQIPVSVGTDYYKVTVSEDTYSPRTGLDASAFVGTFNVNPYSTGTTWDGSWTTGDVKFYLPGTYSFKVVEENTSKGGVTYSTSEYLVTYTVTKKTSAAGAVYLEAEKEVKKDGTATTDSVVFTNEYNPSVTVDGTIKKVVKSVGTVIPKDKTFYFKVSASPIIGVSPIENTCSIKTTETAKTEDTYTTEIGEFKFTRPGTYTITYEETSTSGDGWTTDNNKPTQTITITDNGDGTMTADPSTLGTDISFTNTYDPTNITFNMPVTKVTKADAGSYVPVKDQTWTFTLSAEGTTPLPAKTTTTITTNYGSQGVNGKFDPISYDQVGTYKYTIKETKVDKWSVEPTSASIDLYVKVTDDAAGKLVVTGPYSDEACTQLVEYPTFTNTLTPTPVNSGIPVFKIMNCDLPTGFTEDFEAKISYGSECPEPQYTTCKATIDTAKLKTAFVNEGSTQGFGEIEFTAPGTYTYKVTETKGENSGITYDDSVYTITIVVAQDANDETSLKVTNYGITREKGGQTSTAGEILFENSYAADPAVSLIDGEKWHYEKQDETLGVEFEDGDFKVKVTPDTGNPEGCDFGRAEKQFDIVNLEPAVAGKGKWSTGNITFSEVGTYQFRVSEVDSEVYGVEYSQDYYDVKFDVVDDTKGKLVFTKSVSLNGGSYSTIQTQVNFKNDLIPEPEKVYTNPTCTNKDTVLHIGDTVSYTLKWSNREDVEAEVIVRDIPSLGITFNNDAYDQNNKAIVPTTNNLVQNMGDGKLSIEWNLGKKPSGSYGTITYTITVNEQADMQLGVNNDYYVKVGNNPDMFVNRLSNPYEPPEYVESTNSSPTSDSAGVVALVAICLMCVTGLVCAIVRKNSKW